MTSPPNSTQNGRRPGRTPRAAAAFTLLEVIIAAAVLALAVVMSVGIMGGARARILRAESRWGRQHLLSQAAEVYLLGGPATELPPGLLPEGFSSACTLTPVDDLSEEDLEPQQGWILGCFHISVYDVAGDLMAECRVEKLVREEDCE